MEDSTFGSPEEPAIGREAAAAVEAAQHHARDLLDAAKLLQADFPHLAFHFAVLALEEIGRGVLMVVRASPGSSGRGGPLAEAMEDHVQKPFWALWSPSRADWISGGQIEEFRGLARAIHEQRKSGLYFDPSAASLPREAVSAEETANVIGLAEARLGMEATTSWAPVGSEQADNVLFFTDAVGDPRWREFVFSAASLHIGTLGFFWWRPRADLRRFFEKLRDLDANAEVIIDRSPPLDVDWGRQALTDAVLSRVMTCFALLPRDGDDPVAQALAHYLRALALIAKSDVHIAFNANIFSEFLEALRDGMIAYGDWDRAGSFVERFGEFAKPFFRGDEDEERFIAAARLCEAGRTGAIDLSFEKVIMMKLLADAYYFEKFRERAREREPAEGG